MIHGCESTSDEFRHVCDISSINVRGNTMHLKITHICLYCHSKLRHALSITCIRGAVKIARRPLVCCVLQRRPAIILGEVPVSRCVGKVGAKEFAPLNSANNTHAGSIAKPVLFPTVRAAFGIFCRRLANLANLKSLQKNRSIFCLKNQSCDRRQD